MTTITENKDRFLSKKIIMINYFIDKLTQSSSYESHEVENHP